MSYTRPTYDAADATWQGATVYTRPVYSAADATWEPTAVALYECIIAAPSPLAGAAILAAVGETVDVIIAAPTPLGAPASVVVLPYVATVAAPSPLSAVEIVVQMPCLVTAAAPSVLGASRVMAFSDFAAGLGETETHYVMDLVTPGGTVRVPISSWQATQQIDRANYVQCVVPACEPYVAAIEAASELVVSRRAVPPGGAAVEYQMVRGPVEQASFARGPQRFTCTLSGYTTGFPAGDVVAQSRAVSDVRSESWSASGRRVRCAIDWFLRPGMTVSLPSGATFEASYINYYVGQGDAYMDAGERV